MDGNRPRPSRGDRLPLERKAKVVRIPNDREPTHPGTMLLHEFLQPRGITQRELAAAIDVPFQRVNEVVRGRRGVTPSTALRLSRFFGTTPDLWMSLQQRWDLYHAIRREAEKLDSIVPLAAST